MRLQAGFESAKLVCFGATSHVTVSMNQVREIGPSKKPIGTQLNDARAKDLNDCKPEGKVGNQSFALTLKQKRSGFHEKFRGEQGWRSK